MPLKMKAVRYGTQITSKLKSILCVDVNTDPEYHMELVRYNFTIVSYSLLSKDSMA